MNKTGEIKKTSDLTKEEKDSKEWVSIPTEHLDHLKGLNRKARRAYAKKHGWDKK